MSCFPIDRPCAPRGLNPTVSFLILTQLHNPKHHSYTREPGVTLLAKEDATSICLVCNTSVIKEFSPVKNMPLRFTDGLHSNPTSALKIEVLQIVPSVSFVSPIVCAIKSISMGSKCYLWGVGIPSTAHG